MATRISDNEEILRTNRTDREESFTGQQNVSVEKNPASGPVGQGSHVVAEGECISLLAAKHALRTQDIFDHSANAELKAIRKNPNVLFPRDRVTIPSITEKTESRATDNRHPFQLRGEKVFLRIQVLDRDQPVANQPYTLTVGSQKFEKTTSSDGMVEEEIPATETAGFLRVGAGEDLFQFTLKLGALHPVETNTGVQQRLNNLGFSCGPNDGVIGPRTRAAVKIFQAKFGLTVDGIVGPATREKLKQQYGC